MNKPVPWNIKGVGFDAREAARLAAKRAGLPLGEWLNGVIAARAAELGVSTDDIEADDRLEAIAARLSTDHDAVADVRSDPVRVMPGDAQDSRRADGWSQPSPASWSRQRPARTLRETALPPRGRPVASEQPRVLAMAGGEPIVMPAAVAAFGGTVGARLATAEAPVPVASLPVAPSSVPVDGESLDARLNTILEKLNRSFEEAERFGSAAAADLAKADRRVEDAVPARQTVPATSAGTPSNQAIRPEPGAMRPKLADRGGLEAAFEDLAARAEAQGTVRSDPARTTGAARRLPSQGASTAASERRAAFDMAQHEVARLSDQLAQLAPGATVASLEAAVRDLSGRIDLSRLDGVSASVLAPVERLSREMRDAIRSADPSEAVGALQREMKALGGRIEQWQKQDDATPLAALRTELRAMRTVVDATAERLVVCDRLQDEVVALGGRLDAMAERSTPALSREFGRAVGDIRDLLQQFGADGLLGAVDRQVAALTSRVETLAAAGNPGALVDHLSREIERAHDALAARLAGRGSTASLSGLEERIGTLSAKVDAVGRSHHDMSALYGLVGGLADRIDAARQPDAGTEALNALQAQVGQLVERFDRAEPGATSLGGLERLIGDLFIQVEQSRNVAIDAAENAARTAAQDTLRAAMDNPALNGGELTVQTGLDVDHVSQQLAELQRVQEASERRLNTTLTALNTTLERLVDRMLADRATATHSPVQEDGEGAAPAALKPRRRTNAAGEKASAVFGTVADQPAFDPEHFLLEPGAAPALSVPSMKANMGEPTPPPFAADTRDAFDKANGIAPLIAAARRAAQMAQDAALEASAKAGEAAEQTPVEPGKVKSFFTRRRRPLLLSLAGLVLLLGTLQVVKMTTDRTDDADGSVGRTSTPAAPADTGAGETQNNTMTPVAPTATAPKLPTGDTSLLAPPASDKDATSFAAAPQTDKPATVAAAPAAIADPSLNGFGPGLRSLAAAGEAGAEFEVAQRLADARGVARDPKAAATWFERAAQQGLAPAQYRLGSVYEKGIGRTVDPALAIAWYEKAATAGNVRAMHNLAVMLAEGAGSKPDYGKAVTWFTKAASYGVRDSQFNLAVLYARGLGVPQNLGQSYAWFAVAAQQGDGDAVAKRDTVAAKLDGKALADAKASVASFRPLTPEGGANEVQPPAGGWDAAMPKTASRKVETRVSAM